MWDMVAALIGQGYPDSMKIDMGRISVIVTVSIYAFSYEVVARNVA